MYDEQYQDNSYGIGSIHRTFIFKASNNVIHNKMYFDMADIIFAYEYITKYVITQKIFGMYFVRKNIPYHAE